ncbi:MAG: hypothetical protein WB662_10505, partial [Methyloceanibacter sp.]
VTDTTKRPIGKHHIGVQALELSSKNEVWLVGEPPIDAKNQRGQKLLLGPVRSSARQSSC